MTRKRIIFVDDEPGVLDGLRDLLRRERKRWDMVFALGGKAALAELGKAPTDVIVSDMRMPGMDGATLLGRVRDEYPAVARIVLSGHAEQEAVMRAIPVAHQFLSKPCDADRLRLVIDRACQLRSLLHNDEIRRIIGKLDKIPSVPKIYLELTRVIADPRSGMSDVVKVVEKDPGMTVKILQLVNSAYFGMAQPTTSLAKAVGYLGMELLKGLALTVGVFSSIEGSPPGSEFSMERLQRFSLLTGRIGRLILRGKSGDDAFTAGLVHDVGQIVLALGVPDQFGEVVRRCRDEGRPSQDVEQEVLGVTHAEVGGYLLGTWGLPFPIVEAVAFHHTPDLVTHDDIHLLAAVHVADALIDDALGGGASLDQRLDMKFLDRAGLAAQLPTWRTLAEAELRNPGDAAM